MKILRTAVTILATTDGPVDTAKMDVLAPDKTPVVTNADMTYIGDNTWAYSFQSTTDMKPGKYYFISMVTANGFTVADEISVEFKEA